jgi:CHAD domain-containing protein
VVDGKWIDGLTPDLPAERAAAAVLSARLAAVTHHLPLAVEKADEDVEHVHQLRVATRRAGAALSIFRALLPNKVHKRTKGVLRALRRAAGEARDWDVFLEMLAASEALKVARARAATDCLTGYGLGQRGPAQTDLVTVASEQAEALADIQRELPQELRSPVPPQTLAGLGSTVLPGLFNEFATRVEASPTESTEMHQLRIIGKRLRYAMELFATCYAPSFRESLYPAVEQAQSILGAVQDGQVAQERLEALEARLRQAQPATSKRVKAGFHGLLAEIRKRITSEKRAFRRWERDWRKLSQTLPLSGLLAPVA